MKKIVTVSIFAMFALLVGCKKTQEASDPAPAAQQSKDAETPSYEDRQKKMRDAAAKYR